MEINTNNQLKHYPYPKIGQYRNVVKDVSLRAAYQGKDENGEPVYNNSLPKPKIKFFGTVKLHGTNLGIILDRLNNQIYFQSRENIITPLKDNAGAASYLASIQDKLWELFEPIEGDLVCVYGEWAGCFYYDTPITLADGTKRKIGQIVNGKEELSVLCYNEDSGKLEAKKIVNWFKNGITEDWLTITPRKRHRGGKSDRLIVTPNHKIYRKRNGQIEEVCAGELQVGDVLLTHGDRMPYNVSQYIKGSLLGDASFANYGSISVGHSEKQTPYSDFIRKILTGIGSESTSISGHGSNMVTFNTSVFPEIKDLQDQLKLNGGYKEPTVTYLNNLHPMALAAWYMDDGSLINQGNGRQYQCELHTLGFSYDSNVLIRDWFISHGYDCYLTKHTYESGMKYSVRFTINGAKAFLSVIAPYIIEGLNYKLPESLIPISKIDWSTPLNEYEKSLVEVEILTIEKGNPYTSPHKNMKYDIEVEENHNYFAGKMLVHNSSIQKGVAITQLPKAAYIFDIKVDDEWLSKEQVSKYDIHELKVYNIWSFPNYEIEIDFNHPELSQNTLVDLTLEIEKCCPVGKAFDVEGVGEGIVWKSDFHMFKVKGEEHSASKVKTLASVDVEKVQGVLDFVTQTVTENRCQQSLQKLQESGKPTDQSSTGDFIKWIREDIFKEELDTIVQNGLEVKDLNGPISKAAKDWYFNHM